VAQAGSAAWTDHELRASVEGYVYMLRLEQNGIPCREGTADPVLRAGPLGRRNEASLRYRMRNISAVARELGGPTLAAYSPAEQVGAKVRIRIKMMLETHPIFREFLAPQGEKSPDQAGEAVDRASILEKLAFLRRHIEDFERQLAGIGHNHPPEALDPDLPQREEIERAKNVVAELETEISKQEPDAKIVTDSSRRLLDFGLKVALWIGQRATKFVDAALTTAAPIAVVTAATDLLPAVIDVVKNETRFFVP